MFDRPQEFTDKDIPTPFYEQSGVQKEVLDVGGGIPFGTKQVSNNSLGIGGVYGTWGDVYDNNALMDFIARRLGEEVSTEEQMELSSLGFYFRHHLGSLSEADHLELELQIGEQLLRRAAAANGWETGDVGGVLIGMSGPIADDYVVQICKRAGITESALKVSIHKACDSSVCGLNLTLNRELSQAGQTNIAEELAGKKVLVGGIEGLSRFTGQARDKNALQLFGNGAGIIGVVPGESFKFLVGKAHEAYDEEGVLEVSMYYPHSRQKSPTGSLVEVSQAGPSHLRVAGMMHEPQNGMPVVMAGPMGMVKLFVRTGVQVVSDVFQAYRALMEKLGEREQSIAVAIAHHANYKINLLKEKHLNKLGINIPMPWLLSDFGNVSAASNMIAFLRQLPRMKPGDHILFDGFGAGTYYDVLAISLPG